MHTRSRNPIGRPGTTGALLLGLILAAVPAVAQTAATSGSAKRDTVKAAASKTAPKATSVTKSVSTSSAKPTATNPAIATAPAPPTATGTKATAKPAMSRQMAAARRGPPPTRLATVAVKTPTRATAMRNPEATRTAIAQAAKAAKTTPVTKTAPVAKGLPAPGPASQKTFSTTAPVAGVTPKSGPTRPVPTGIPAAPNTKVAGAQTGKGSSRILPATATGLAVVRPAPKAAVTTPAADKNAPGPDAKGSVATKAGKVTPIEKATPSRRPTVSAETKKAPVLAPLPFEDQVAYQYNALGRRDPFSSLLEGEFVGMDVGGDAPPDLGGLKVVGIVWGSDDQFAMVEDVKGNSYVLRRGDKVQNGFVEGLKRDAIIVNITVDGQSQSVTIPITRKGEKSNANR
jgi:hypothetical protein